MTTTDSDLIRTIERVERELAKQADDLASKQSELKTLIKSIGKPKRKRVRVTPDDAYVYLTDRSEPVSTKQVASDLDIAIIEAAKLMRELQESGRVYRLEGMSPAWAPAVTAPSTPTSELVEVVRRLIAETEGGDARTLGELTAMTGQSRQKVSDCLTRIQKTIGAVRILPDGRERNASYLIPADEVERLTALENYLTEEAVRKRKLAGEIARRQKPKRKKR